MGTSHDSPRVGRQRALFGLFDVNRDGAIDEHDFAAIEARSASYLPGAALPPEEVTHAARLRMSQFRKADADRDRKVTEAEWLDHCAKELGGDALGPEAQAFARAFFRTLDVNRDNAIDLGDYAYAHLAHGLNPTAEALLAGFRALDANGTGKVSLAEFLDAYARYVASDAADVPALLVR
jgi:Ca2+-binding EF-hand superfamily protein